MSLYVMINLLIVFFPVVLSFDKKVAFHKRWLPLLLSIILVGAAYIAWDVWATARGDWWFSPEHIGLYHLLGLPPGEWLFFVTVPYACIFVYECLRAYLTQKQWNLSSWVLILAGSLVLTAGLIFHSQDYSLTVAIAFFISLLVAALFYRDMIRQNITWIYLAITMLLFLVVNSFLAGIPIVNYNPGAFSGIRVITIPLEDFAYNSSYLMFILMSYISFKRLLRQDV